MKNIYSTLFLLILQFSIFNFQSYSQTAPAIEWQNDIGGDYGDEVFSISQPADNGYICGGRSNSNISGDKTENCIGSFDYWIVKTDSSGNIQWQNTIGGNGQDDLLSVSLTTDGGYICGGTSKSDSSGDKTENRMGAYDYWIVKLDSIGNIQWENTIGGNHWDAFSSVSQTTDGGYILGGSSSSNISGDKTENSVGGWDYWIVKIDSLGNIQWQNTIGGSDEDELGSVYQTIDGGYVCGGWSWSDSSGDKTENNVDTVFYTCDYWVVKLDSIGNIQWQNTIGGYSMDLLHSVSQTSDGGFICGGTSRSDISGDKTENSQGDYDYWIIKVDDSGNIQWQNTIGGGEQDILYFIYQTPEGGYICGGWSRSDSSGDKTENNWDSTLITFDYWVVKLDASGNIQWQNNIGGDNHDRLYSLSQTSDSGYILGGGSSSNFSGDKSENCWGSFDYWIVKLAPDTITGIPNLQLPTSNFQFFPNPLTTQSKIAFSNPTKEKFVFTLYDITGRLCDASPLERGQGCVITTDDKIILKKENKQPGVYLFNLTNQKTGERMNGKIIISD